MAGFRLKNLGHQQITSLSAAQALTVPTGANLCVLVATTQNVRLRDDGGAPTAGVGLQLVTGVPYTYDGELNRLQIIEETTSAKLDVSYYLCNY